MTDRTYARVYHEIVDDPRFERVYANNDALATWLRMLLVADAMYPASAPLPRSNSPVRLLLEVGLIQERPGHRYIIHGLEAERERRSASARNAAAVRWHSEGNADAMLAKQSKSKAEQSNGANASKATGTFMGYGPKASAADIKAQHDDTFVLCGQCGERKGAPSHGYRRNHEFTVAPA